MRILKIWAKIMIIQYIGCSTIFITSPLVVYILTGKTYEPILAWYLPGTEIARIPDYLINLLLQAMTAALDGLTYAYFDLLFIIQILHMILLTTILQHKMDEINTMILAKSNETPMINLHFRNIIMLHNEMLA